MLFQWFFVLIIIWNRIISMEWFGLTSYGTSDYIKKMIRDDYKEPVIQKDLLEVSNTKRNFAELMKVLDVYLGQADGFAYKSYDRLTKMRKKGNFKPVGPTNMYKHPLCTSMEHGWFLEDPALKNEDWYKVDNIYN